MSTERVFDDKGGPRRRLQGITVDAVEHSPGFTSVRWTLRSITDQPSFLVLPFGPPVSARLSDRMGIFNPGSASGPRLRPADGGPLLKARWMTTRVELDGYYECLCTDLGLWASSLRQAGSAVDVVTEFPSLPAGVTAVDVILPGVGTIRGLPVTPATDVAAQVRGTRSVPTDVWTYRDGKPPSGWSTYDWPTPLPDLNQLKDYTKTVEDLVTRPDGEQAPRRP